MACGVLHAFYGIRYGVYVICEYFKAYYNNISNGFNGLVRNSTEISYVLA